MSSVLIIEDDPAMLRGLKDNFAKNGYVVRTASDGDQGLALALAEKPDLIVLDIMLPGLNGYEVCRELRREGCDIPTIILTAKAEESDLLLGLGLGADDYMTKPFSVRELLARAEALLRRAGKDDSAPAVMVFGDYELDSNARVLREKNRGEIDLSPKEFGMLKYFLQHPGRALSREQIMNAVWGYDALVTPRSIDRFVTSLRKKIESNPRRPRHLTTVREFGYKFTI